ncbi:hypothetical protein ACJJTC_017545 [Scirpophaga incertulas]
MELSILLQFYVNFVCVFCFDSPTMPKTSFEARADDALKHKSAKGSLEYLTFEALVEKGKDTSEFWRATEILSLVREKEQDIDYEQCERGESRPALQLPSTRERATYLQEQCW